MANKRDSRKKAAHRSLMAQHTALKQKKVMDQIMKIQEVLAANPHLAEQIGNQPVGIPEPSQSLPGGYAVPGSLVSLP
jgi:hypothetical protein